MKPARIQVPGGRLPQHVERTFFSMTNDSGIPPMSTSPNGDLEAGLLIGLFFLIFLFLPFIPVLNKLPRRLGVYKLIWRDWYQKQHSSSRIAGHHSAGRSSAAAD